jgi:hypothetical protein
MVKEQPPRQCGGRSSDLRSDQFRCITSRSTYQNISAIEAKSCIAADT